MSNPKQNIIDAIHNNEDETTRIPADSKLTRVAIFASGAGSNAQKIMEYFSGDAHIKIALVVSNKAEAGVLKHAENFAVPHLIIEKEKFFRGDGYVNDLLGAGISFIVLAGFLWKIPQSLLEVYSGKIINIHPALLPNYGGKGMYGAKVHEAVIASGDKTSGITIHQVDGQYDNGSIVFQATCLISDNDTPETLANKIHGLEHQHYPRVIKKYIKSLAE